MRVICRVTICLLGSLITLIAPQALPEAPKERGIIDSTIAGYLVNNLAGRKVAASPLRTRGSDLETLYRASVVNVPVVLSKNGLGSSTVIIVKPNHQAFVITNYHVVQNPFNIKGQPSVFVLFYDAVLKNELFDGQRFGNCLSSPHDQSAWCQAVRRSMRVGTVVRTDAARDLALVSIAKAPENVTGFQPGNLTNLQPGNTVAAIGHPTGLLWSFTTGIISAVRTNFLLGNGFGTVLQTQTPINPGNSGGPLIGMDGNVAGIVFGARAGKRLRIGDQELTMPMEGLNYAIGIDAVLAFINGPSEAEQSPSP